MIYCNSFILREKRKTGPFHKKKNHFWATKWNYVSLYLKITDKLNSCNDLQRFQRQTQLFNHKKPFSSKIRNLIYFSRSCWWLLKQLCNKVYKLMQSLLQTFARCFLMCQATFRDEMIITKTMVLFYPFIQGDSFLFFWHWYQPKTFSKFVWHPRQTKFPCNALITRRRGESVSKILNVAAGFGVIKSSNCSAIVSCFSVTNSVNLRIWCGVWYLDLFLLLMINSNTQAIMYQIFNHVKNWWRLKFCHIFQQN